MPQMVMEHYFIDMEVNSNMIKITNIKNSRDYYNTAFGGNSCIIGIDEVVPYGACGLNRDGFGDVKTVLMGGKLRAMHSSQCRKYAVRNSEILKRFGRAKRTRSLPDLVANRVFVIAEAEKTEDAYNKYKALVYLTIDGKKEKGIYSANITANPSMKTKAIYTVGEVELDGMANSVLKTVSLDKISEVNIEKDEKCVKTGDKETSEFVDNLEKRFEKKSTTPVLSFEECMFGRQSTSGIEQTVESAIQVANAYGTNEYSNDVDYFTGGENCFADITGIFDGSSETGGAGYLGERTISSDTFYGWMSINLETYICNVLMGCDFSDKSDENQKAIDDRVKGAMDYLCAVLETIVLADPVGGQTQGASHPDHIVNIAVKENGINRTLDATFATDVIEPSDDESVFEQSVNKMVEAINDKTYERGTTEKAFWIAGNSFTGNGPEGSRKSTVEEMSKAMRDYFYGKI